MDEETHERIQRIQLENHVKTCSKANCQRCIDAKPPARPWPGDEGFCSICHLIVAAADGKLVEHQGAWSRHYNNGPCGGSWQAPGDPGSNLLDPWSEDE